MDREDVVVIGGGIVGIACAYKLQSAGRSVLLVDKEDPGQGCSFGNAGVIAASFILPLSNIKNILAVPRMLLSSSGPLSLRWRDLPHMLPWLAQFLLNAHPARQKASREALAEINGRSLQAWRELLESCDRRALLVENGMLDVVRTPQGARTLAEEGKLLEQLSIKTEYLPAEDVLKLEGALSTEITGGLLHSDLAHVQNPFAVSCALLEAFVVRGGRVKRTQVKRVSPEGDGAVLACGHHEIRANQVVIATGIASVALMEPFGVRVPLRAERGYHLMLPRHENVLSRPVSFRKESFLATPMADGLRLAGTVELCRPDREPNWRRSDQLFPLAKRYLGGIEYVNASRWMGSRPSFADSLPAIGRLNGTSIIYAFGHQHLGLTQAAVTAEWVVDLSNSHALPGDLTDRLSVERFG